MYQCPGGKPLYRGAESYIYETVWLGVKALIKCRIPKTYRHPELDKTLRKRRTIVEAKMLTEAATLGVPVPTLLHVDVNNAVLVVEKVEGVLLSTLLDEKGVDSHVSKVLAKLGHYIGILHENNIVHGDLSTSNVVVQGDEPFIIDFGLAEHSSNELDKAVDIHLFLRSLESTHPEHAANAYRRFVEGYAEARGAEKANQLQNLVERIRAMGRYVEEAKRVALVWRH